jgi:hypothetical protein
LRRWEIAGRPSVRAIADLPLKAVVSVAIGRLFAPTGDAGRFRRGQILGALVRPRLQIAYGGERDTMGRMALGTARLGHETIGARKRMSDD